MINSSTIRQFLVRAQTVSFSQDYSACEIRGEEIMKRYQVCILASLSVLILIAIFGITNINAAEDDDKNVCFCWAFGGIVKGTQGLELISIARDATLKTGDRLKLLIELKKKCFVYVIYRSSQGKVALLFPYEVRQFADDYITGKKYFIPQGDRWFELDENKGEETFYLLASAQRLTELETLLEQYMSAEQSEKPTLGTQVLARIRMIKKQHHRLTTTAERPVPIGGCVRGLDKDNKASLPDITTVAVRISADNFFSRTFTIDHR
jgi:hypothetical protein